MKMLMLAFAVIAASGNACADTLTLEATADATLFQASAGNPETADSQGPHLFVGRIAQGLRRRALLRFDLDTLPTGAIITDAHLELSVSRTVSGSVDVNLHRLTSTWREGSANGGTPGGQGTTPDVNDPTWSLSATPATLWATLGGDFAATISGTFALDAEGRYIIPASTGMLADLMSWTDDANANFGWVLVSDESQTPPTAKRLESAEAADASTRPLLVIDYRLAPRVPVPALGTLALVVLTLAFALTAMHRHR